MRGKYLFVFFSVALFLVMPFGVVAKNYDVAEFYDLDNSPIVEYGDTIDGVSYGFLHVNLSNIKYKGFEYYIDQVMKEETDIFKYNYDYLLPAFEDLKNSAKCIKKKIPVDEGSFETINICPGTSEYTELIDYIFDESNKPQAKLSFMPYSMLGGQLTINLNYPEAVERKISLNVSYFNLMNTTNYNADVNPVSYVTEDGTVILQDLERDGYLFGGWFLDSEYQYRVTTLTQELVEEYFDEESQYSEIEKQPLQEVNGELVGKIDLYAKWDAEKITNPQTSSTIGRVILVLLLVVLSFVTIYRKKNIKSRI